MDEETRLIMGKNSVRKETQLYMEHQNAIIQQILPVTIDNHKHKTYIYIPKSK